MRLREGIAHRIDDTSGTLEAMQILLDDGSILPDVAYITSAQLGRPFKVTWTQVPEREAMTTPIRQQFADGTVTRGKKFEGIYSDDRGAYIVNSFAFGASDLPADATKHDGMVWYYDYADETITLVTYFPHNPLAEGEGPFPTLVRPVLRRAGQRHRDAVGHARPGGGRRARLARAELGARRPDVRHRPQPVESTARRNGTPTYSEFTGPTFTPDGKVLFVNIQSPGITLAITGPWSRYLG